MSSTGMAFSGKFDVTWNSTNLERVGDCELPSTLDNEVQELVSNKATRKDIIPKDGYQDITLTLFFNPANKEMLYAAKTGNSVGTLGYSCAASDGGSYVETYDAKVVSVSGGSGDVEGVMESFECTFSPVKRLSATGSLGTQAYD